MSFWAVVFIITTTILIFKKEEKDEEEVEGVFETYKQLYTGIYGFEKFRLFLIFSLEAGLRKTVGLHCSDLQNGLCRR